jgi:hypothetical protein
MSKLYLCITLLVLLIFPFRGAFGSGTYGCESFTLRVEHLAITKAFSYALDPGPCADLEAFQADIGRAPWFKQATRNVGPEDAEAIAQAWVCFNRSGGDVYTDFGSQSSQRVFLDLVGDIRQGPDEFKDFLRMFREDGTVMELNEFVSRVRAWEVAFNKNLPEALRRNTDVLETIGKYQNSSYSSRLGDLSNQDFADHFSFIANNSEARQRFTQFLDDELIFLPRSDLEKAEILKILDRDRLKIFDPVSPGLSRLNLYKRLIDDAPNPSNSDEALGLINRMLDDVEDAYSGVAKNPNAINMPNIVDGRMYGILDNKYVKLFPDGSRRAFTRKNTIMINSDGSFTIYSRNKNNPPNQIGNVFVSKGS